MKKGQDLEAHFGGLMVIHQNMPGRTVETHEHEEHHLFVPLQGEVHLQFAAEEWVFGPGKMAYLPGGLPHAFHSAERGQGERIICMISELEWKTLGGHDLAPSLLPLSQLVKEILFYSMPAKLN